jgi:hypothetical protein
MKKSTLFLIVLFAIFFTSTLVLVYLNYLRPQSISTSNSSNTSIELTSPTPDSTVKKNSISPPETVKSENKEQSEIISLDNVWNLYKNNQLGFSIKFPKISRSSLANCREENGQFYNQEGALPITVFAGQKNLHIAPEYFYDPIRENKNGYSIWSNCIKTNVTANLIEERRTLSDYILPSSIWTIVVKEINNEQELGQFVKSSYGSSCSYALKEIPQKDVFKVQINSDGADNLFESKCPVNFMLEFMYSPKYNKAATWSIGQEPTFIDSEGNVLDSEMIESFTFF